jgi:hypothetical protein
LKILNINKAPHLLSEQINAPPLTLAYFIFDEKIAQDAKNIPKLFSTEALV